MKPKVELLCPAGTLKAMRYAFAYGADAVYAGQPRFSLRVRNNEFHHLENLALAIAEAHEAGKKFYLVVNIAAHNDKLKNFIEELKPVIALSPDALIMSDPGMIMLVREHFPEIEIHLSVQANAVNWASVKFWQKQGLSRVILSRELSLKEIEEIRQAVPDMELEVFVHGALCMAYSGRCLLSGYINHRDANQGTCTNACRWRYSVEQAQEDLLGDIVAFEGERKSCCHDQDKVPPVLGLGSSTDIPFILRDPQRPEQEMTAFEDEHGTYIMNSKDLRAVQYVEKLIEIGVHSLKIEGRTKSHYYVARTAQIYRRAIDDALAGKAFDPSLMDMLESLAHRGYTEGFLQRHKHKEYQNYLTGSSHLGKQSFVGEIGGKNAQGWTEILVKNRFAVGDRLELMTPSGNVNFCLNALRDKNGKETYIAPGDGHIVYVQLPTENDLRYALLMRYL